MVKPVFPWIYGNGDKIDTQNQGVFMNVHTRIAKHMLVDHFDMVYDIEKSHDNFLYDSKNRRELLDCFSFIATNPIGYNHPKMNDPNFEKKLLKIAKVNPSNSDILTEEMADFVDCFSKITPLKNLFFVAGGSVAVENALKTAFDWKIRKNWEKDIHIHPNELDVVHFDDAFHGRTGYTLSLLASDPKKYKLCPKFNWTRIKKTSDFWYMGNTIREIIENKKDYIAAIIIETIQGEGGDYHFEPEFHQFLRQITLENDILLIYDEVQTGIGLTGKMWAFQHFDILPDIAVFGKKTQVCGIMCSDRIKEVPNNVFVEKSRLNSTFGGNLVDMVRCQRYLEIITEDSLVENAKVVGDYLLKKLEDLGLPGVRGRGLMVAFDLSDTKERDCVLKKLNDKMIVLPCGKKSIRFRPHLIFTKENVDLVVEIVKNSPL